MDIIDNLKKIGKNWRYLALVIWLLVGVATIQFPNEIVSTIGVLIFLPFLVFLMFLFFLSLISKKDINEYPPWKILLFLIISLPIMLIISIILIVLFAISIISYFFFTSWFIMFGSYLVGNKVDTKLRKTKFRLFLRFFIFFGGTIGSLVLLYFFIVGPALMPAFISELTTLQLPAYFNVAYIVVGIVIIVLAIFCLIYMFGKHFNGWFGIFAPLVSIYTLFLVLKIYLGLDIAVGGVETASSIWTDIGLIVVDLLILLYALSTLMGSQAELLSKRFKRFGLDTVIIWLILSKVSYEFIHYFPYSVFEAVNIPWLNELTVLANETTINNIKNIAVLGFFILLLAILGMYEIIKYAKDKKKVRGEIKIEGDFTSPEFQIEEPSYTEETPPPGEAESKEEISIADFEEKDDKDIDNDSKEND